MSDAVCANCRQVIRVHWFFRSFFFIVSFIAAVFAGLIVFAHQGFYAALLLLPLPIGVIGYVKARFSPLVVGHYEEPAPRPPVDAGLSRE